MLKLSPDIKMIASDFDGVFTDGLFYIDENMVQQKRMSFKDVMAVSILLKNNIKFALISGETTNILDYFRNKFGIEEIHKGIRQKDVILKQIMKKYNLSSDEIAYIGDDINDIPAFECVKYKIAPKNANPYIKQIENIQITENNGGDGAFRELADTLIGVKK